ncbi:four helix bundle protein [soil metagenome]|jgi:four helix bundle protein
MDRNELQQRTKKFHVDVIRLCSDFPKNAAGFETAKQLIRSAGSIGANYRATKRAKSNADFIYKVEIVLEEADESHYWLEVVKDVQLTTNIDVDRLIDEASQLTAIFAATDKTAKAKKSNK